MFSCTQDDLNELYDMLSTCRPYNSATDHQFVEEFLKPLGVQLDGFGNAILKIGDLPVIWSSHTDTVHRNHGMQKIVRDDKYNLKLSSKSSSSCLGADDTAGVWLMTQMIKAKRPGVYVFHRGEECGGKGSKWLVKNTPEVAKDIQTVIALDRKGTDSIITFQVGGRCCSEDFSKSMGDILGSVVDTLKYKSDNGGTFTDSASYTDIVGECTNLSVGYYDQHFHKETLNMPHLIKLREALIRADFSKLVFKRKPGEVEYKYNNTGWSYDSDHYGELPYNGTRRSYHGGSQQSQHNKSYTRNNDRYYEDEYRGGYWESMRWVTCNREAWVLWRDKLVAKRAKDAKDKESKAKKPTTSLVVVSPTTPLVTTVAEPKLEGGFDLDLLLVIKTNAVPLTRMMADWGFDKKALTSMLEEYYYPNAQPLKGAEIVVKKEEGGPRDSLSKLAE